MQATLINHMGSDDTVVDAARVSFSKEAHHYNPEQNDRLIKYLASHGHFTPFTHCMITVREKVPIFVARQRFKHAVGFSYNEISRRYVDDDPEFFIPTTWRGRAENKKQGSSEERLVIIDSDTGDEVANSNEWCDDMLKFVHYTALKTYNLMLKNGVAPEQARMVLPQSMYTEYFCTGSLMAFARAYKLRSEESAQKEIQDLANQWDELIRPLFPNSWSALIDQD